MSGAACKAAICLNNAAATTEATIDNIGVYPAEQKDEVIKTTDAYIKKMIEIAEEVDAAVV